MTEMNMNGYEYLFNSKEGQEALKGLQRYGVNDLTPYEEWQLEFYLDNPLPWPRCCELFGQYAKYIAGHDEMPFDAWLATIEYDPALSDGENATICRPSSWKKSTRRLALMPSHSQARNTSTRMCWQPTKKILRRIKCWR